MTLYNITAVVILFHALLPLFFALCRVMTRAPLSDANECGKCGPGMAINIMFGETGMVVARKSMTGGEK